MSICSIPDCDRPAIKRGWCSAHYQRWRKYGDPLAGGTATGEPMKFLVDVILTYEGDDCLAWPFGKGTGGRGVIHINGEIKAVHRVVCEAVHGAPPTSDHEAAHSCGKGHLACVTKAHLSWKTHTENMADKLVHGTHPMGEKCNFAKITADQARQIMAAKGQVTQSELASRFGIDQSAVSHIHRGKSWAWLNQEGSSQ